MGEGAVLTKHIISIITTFVALITGLRNKNIIQIGILISIVYFIYITKYYQTNKKCSKDYRLAN